MKSLTFDEIKFIDVPEGPIADIDGGVEAVLPFLFDESMHTAVLDARDPRRAYFKAAITDEWSDFSKKGRSKKFENHIFRKKN